MCAGWILVRTSFDLAVEAAPVPWSGHLLSRVQRRHAGLPGGLQAFYLSGLPLCRPCVQLLWHLFGALAPEWSVRRWYLFGVAGERGESWGVCASSLDCRLPFPLMLCKMHPSGSIANGCCCQKKAGDLFPEHATGAWVYLLPQIRCLSLCCRVFFGE